jgi:hypothetical protein
MIKEEKLNKLNIQNYAKLVNGAGGTRSLDKVSEMGIQVLTEVAFGTDADNKTDVQE